MNTSPLRVLLIENDPGDIFITQRALKKFSVSVEIETQQTGAAALDYLNACAAGSHALPDLILLDINLPLVSGHELLQSVKAVPLLADIPVIVLSGSSDARDSQNVLAAGAVRYLSKPNNLDEFANVFMIVESYCQSIHTQRQQPA